MTSDDNLGASDDDGGEFKHLDISKLSHCPRILIVGKKSFAKCELINHLIPLVMGNKVGGNISIITPHLNQKLYKELYGIPSIVRNDMDETYLSKLSMVSKYKISKNLDFANILIIDELINPTNWKDNKSMHEILFNARALQTSIIISMRERIPHWTVPFTHIFIMQDEIMNVVNENLWKIYDIDDPSHCVMEKIKQKYLTNDNCYFVIEKMDNSLSYILQWYKIPVNILAQDNGGC